MNDWDAVEQIWNATFRDMLRVDPAQHPLLLTEPAWNTTENREKAVELAFEKFSFPAFYLAKDAVMTALVVIDYLGKYATWQNWTSFHAI